MHKRYGSYFLSGLVSCITLAVYLSALQNDFVVWDDDIYITANVHIRSLDMTFLTWAFSDFYASNWHPLTWMSHALDYAIWGLNPLGHHLTSVILHAINTYIVVLLSVKLLELYRDRTLSEGATTVLDDQRIAIAGGVTGLLFGLHPLHVESVAWVSERKDVLYGLFFLLSTLAYIHAVRGLGAERGEQKRSVLKFSDTGYLLSLGLFILSLLSKPMAVGLPLVLLILDWHPFGRIRSLKTLRTSLVEKLPFIACSILSSGVTLLAQEAGGALGALGIVPFSTRILVAAKALTGYLVKMALPVDLLPLYPYPREMSLLSPGVLLAVLLVAGVTAISVIVVRNQKLWLSVWSYYVATLFPVLGIVQVGLQSMADRYTYLPSIGPFLLIALAIAWVYGKADAFKGHKLLVRVFGAVAICMIVSLSYATFKQIGIWKSTIELWSHVIEKEPVSIPEAYFKRGNAFRQRGRLDRTIEDYNRAIALDPSFEQVYVNRGAIFGVTGQFDKAIKDFTTALSLDPAQYTAVINRGYAFIETGQFDKALEDFDKAVALNPADANAYLNRGIVHLKTGSKERAASDFQQACVMGSREGCNALQRGGF
jgi:hypothetical protein